MGVRKYTQGSTIDAALRALVELRVSQLNGCAYCLDLHSREARDAGVSQQRIDTLAGWREVGFFTAREKAALRWAESLTHVSTTHAGEADYAAAREHFDDRELVDLTVVIAMMNAWNRLAVGFGNGPKERDAGG